MSKLKWKQPLIHLLSVNGKIWNRSEGGPHHLKLAGYRYDGIPALTPMTPATKRYDGSHWRREKEFPYHYVNTDVRLPPLHFPEFGRGGGGTEKAFSRIINEDNGGFFHQPTVDDKVVFNVKGNSGTGVLGPS